MGTERVHKVEDRRAGVAGGLERRWVAYVVIVLVTIVTLGACVRNGFTTWDDDDTIARNPDLNPAVTGESFEHFWTRAQGDLYVPVTYTAWGALAPVARRDRADRAGVTLSAGVYHGFNVLVHAGSAVLVYELLRRVTGKKWGAVVGALLFAVHPVQVESVAWASGTKDLLAGLFSLGALNFYVVGERSKVRRQKPRTTLNAQRSTLNAQGEGGDSGGMRWGWVLGVVCFVLAVLSKPSCVALPVGAVAIGRFVMGRSWRGAVWSVVGWVAVAVPAVVVGKWAQPAHVVPFVPGVWDRGIVAGDAAGFYLGKMVAPVGLSIDYGRTPLEVLGAPGTVYTCLAAIGLVAGVYALRRVGVVVAGAGIFLAGVLPVLGFVPFDFQQYSTVSDHYLYLAMVGPCLIVAWYWPRRVSWAGVAAAGVLVGVLAGRSFARTGAWKDSQTLFARTLEVNPGSVAARVNLAIALTEEGRLGEAAGEYRAVLRRDFSNAKAHLGLGEILARSGRTGEGLAEMRTAVALGPRDPRGHYNLGLLLASMGQNDEALGEYERAVELDPGFAEAQTNLGTVLLMRGDLEGAERHYRKALEIRPELTVPRRGLEAVDAARRSGAGRK